MYKHVVLWKLNTEFTELEKENIAIEVKKRLDSLPSIIPEIESYEVGINLGSYGASFFDVSLISSFIDEQSFKTYCVYPEHDEVVAYIQTVCEAEEIVDYII